MREWSVGWLVARVKEGFPQGLAFEQKSRGEGKDLGGALVHVREQQRRGPRVRSGQGENRRLGWSADVHRQVARADVDVSKGCQGSRGGI